MNKYLTQRKLNGIAIKLFKDAVEELHTTKKDLMDRLILNFIAEWHEDKENCLHKYKKYGTKS